MPEFRLLNGEEVQAEGLSEVESVKEAKQLVAAALKVFASQVVLLDQGVLEDASLLPESIQVYIQELKISKEEFLKKAWSHPRARRLL